MNRFKFYFSSILSIFLLVLFTGCSQVSFDESKTEWTFLFYNDADFYPGFDPMLVFGENMFSSDNVHVLALRDPFKWNSETANNRLGRQPGDSTAAIYLVDHQQQFQLLKELGEVSMGASKTLSDFIMYAKTLYPAERYVLSIYGHGGGISGACSDDTDDDWLRMYEMKEGLKNSGGVDMIIFSAPCLMGEIGAVYELRNYVDVYIGSENVSGYIFWENPMGDIRDMLNNHPSIDTYDLGREIIKHVERNLAWVESEFKETSGQATMSAIRTDRISDLVILFENIIVYYLNHQEKFNQFMDTRYSEIETYYDWNMDLVSFLNKLMDFENDGEIVEKLTQLKGMVKTVVLAETHGSAYPDSHGLAIYHPNKNTILLNSGVYQMVDFGRDTHWDELLVNYFGPEKILEGDADTGEMPSVIRRPLTKSSGYSPGELK